MSKFKNTLDEIDGRLNIVEETVRGVEDIAIEKYPK